MSFPALVGDKRPLFCGTASLSRLGSRLAPSASRCGVMRWSIGHHMASPGLEPEPERGAALEAASLERISRTTCFAWVDASSSCECRLERLRLHCFCLHRLAWLREASRGQTKRESGRANQAATACQRFANQLVIKEEYTHIYRDTNEVRWKGE